MQIKLSIPVSKSYTLVNINSGYLYIPPFKDNPLSSHKSPIT